MMRNTIKSAVLAGAFFLAAGMAFSSYAEEEEREPVENLGAKRNKNETAEEKRLRKQKVKEAKNVGVGSVCENRPNDSRKSS